MNKFNSVKLMEVLTFYKYCITALQSIVLNRCFADTIQKRGCPLIDACIWYA